MIWISRIVIPMPQADDHVIKPDRRRWPLRTSFGSKEPCLSRGTSKEMSPDSLDTVFALVPLREFGCSLAEGSPSRTPSDRSAQPASHARARP